MSLDQENDVRIQEPAFQEIKKKTSCFKRACINSCGLIVFLLIGSFIFLRLIASPHTKSLSVVPPALTETFPIYDTENIESIALQSGGDRQQKWQRIIFLPKLFISPLVISEPKLFLEEHSFGPTSTKKEIFKTFLQTPLFPAQDTYTFTWSHLSADPNFIFSFYQNELEQKGYSIPQQSQTTSLRKLNFIRENIFGTLTIQDDPEEAGTDHVILTLSIHTSDT